MANTESERIPEWARWGDPEADMGGEPWTIDDWQALWSRADERDSVAA